MLHHQQTELAVNLPGDMSTMAVMRAHAHERVCFGAHTAETLVPVQVNSVSFSGTSYWQLESDSGSTQYSAPQWTGTLNTSGTGNQDYAVAYTRNTKPQVGAKFTIPFASTFRNIAIQATGTDGFTIPATTGSVASDGVTLTLPLTSSTCPLPNTIKYYNKADSTAFIVNWQISTDGGATWLPVATTKHTVYITLDNPTTPGSENQETPFYIGCKYANGETSQSDLINDVWSDFKGLKVYRVGTNTPMTYYGASLV